MTKLLFMEIIKINVDFILNYIKENFNIYSSITYEDINYRSIIGVNRTKKRFFFRRMIINTTYYPFLVLLLNYDSINVIRKYFHAIETFKGKETRITKKKS